MDFVTISGIVSCNFCPVRYYLEKSRDYGSEKPEYTISKQISYRFGRELCEDEIWDEILIVNPDVGDDSYPQFQEWLDKCRNSEWPVPAETDISVRSNRLGIVGKIDCLYEEEPKIGIVRASPAPETGIYKSDRIRSAMAAICAGETFGYGIEEAALLYVPDGKMKICRPSPSDRRAGLRALSVAKKIDWGYIPEKKNTDRCEYCYLKDYCDSEPKRLSELL